VAGGLVAVALTGMARPKPQVQAMQPGQPRPTQQSTGPFPQQPPYGPPR